MTDPSNSRFRTTQDSYQQTLRQGILDDASSLLVQEGPQALSMRRVAQLVGCSTTVLYTLFGNKQGLVDELYGRGFALLRQALEAVPRSPQTLDYLLALGRAYRTFALANASYYAIMFFQVLSEYAPSETNRLLGQASFDLVEHTLQDYITATHLTGGDAREISFIIWATLHGHVGLELSHYLDAKVAEKRFETALRTLLTGLLCPTGDLA